MRHWFLALVVVLFGNLAFAAVSITPVFVQTPKAQVTTFVQGTDSAGTYKTIYTGGSNGSKVFAVYVSSTDGTATHLVTVQVSTSTSAHCSPQSGCAPAAAITIPVNAGFTSGTPPVTFLPWAGLPFDSDGNAYLFLQDGTGGSGHAATLEATFATALTASTQLAVTVIAADF